MLKAVASIVTLALGIAAGYGVKLYQDSVAVTALPKADRAVPVQTTASYVCQWNGGTKESALVIKSDSTGAKEMIFPWRTDGDLWRVDETTDLHYIATNVEEKFKQISISTMDLNRVTGDLYIVNRYTEKAMPIMAAFCAKKIQGSECIAEMAKLGGNKFSCMVISDDYCKPTLEGNNFQMRSG